MNSEPQFEQGPTLLHSRSASPSPSCHDEASSSGLPRYAPPSIFPRDYNAPLCIDHTSQFFHILTAPYRPLASFEPWVRTTPRQQDRERCAAMVEWGDADEHSPASVPQEGSSTSQGGPSSRAAPDKNLVKDMPIYVPHGPYAWAAGEDIQQTETLLSLRRAFILTFSFSPTHKYFRGLDVRSLHTNWRHCWAKDHFYQPTVRGYLWYALSSTTSSYTQMEFRQASGMGRISI